MELVRAAGLHQRAQDSCRNRPCPPAANGALSQRSRPGVDVPQSCWTGWRTPQILRRRACSRRRGTPLVRGIPGVAGARCLASGWLTTNRRARGSILPRHCGLSHRATRALAALDALTRRDRGELEDENFQAIVDDAVKDLIRKEERHGLPIVTDGEFRRHNFQESFGGAVSGFDATPYVYVGATSASWQPGRIQTGVSATGPLFSIAGRCGSVLRSCAIQSSRNIGSAARLLLLP